MRAVTRAAASIFLFLAIGSPQAAQDVGLRDLRGIDELKSWFNAEKGRPRLILLLSPT